LCCSSLAQKGHEDVAVAGAGGDREQRVIAADPGALAAKGTVPRQPYASQIVESRSIVRGSLPGPAPAA
jgi:hypothetical protein